MKSAFVTFLIFSLLGVAVLGIGIGMEMKDRQMSFCPLMARQTTMCQMNITEHIAQWQQAFLGIPTKGDFLTLAVLLFAIILIPFTKQFSQLEKLTESATRLFAYHKANLVKVFDPLLIAFSDGILNPKIY